jgi:hypothetical protein
MTSYFTPAFLSSLAAIFELLTPAVRDLSIYAAARGLVWEQALQQHVCHESCRLFGEKAA